MEVLEVAYYIINAAIVVLLAPLIEGIMRKTIAVLQGRQGPPVLQPYNDLAKLLRRTLVTQPQVTWESLYQLTPVIMLTSTVVAAALVPTIVAKPLALSDIILIFYIMAIGRFVYSIASFNTANPYAVIGSAREHILTLGVEPAALLAALIMAVLAHSNNVGYLAMVSPTVSAAAIPVAIIAFIGFVSALLADLAVPPFDIAEAEQEISEGLLAEYGGPYMALIKLSVGCKRLLLLNLLFLLFLPFGMATTISPLSVLVSIVSYLAKVIVSALILSIIVVSAARLRLHQLANYLLYSVLFSIVAGLVYISFFA